LQLLGIGSIPKTNLKIKAFELDFGVMYRGCVIEKGTRILRLCDDNVELIK